MNKAIQIRDVPDEVHRKLKARAAQQGRTLSEMLRLELEVIASQPSLEDVLDQIGSDEPVLRGESSAVAVRRGRAER